MAIAGLFSVLAWNTVLPDRRDCLVLGLLPVRLRTVFLAKVAALATALGVSVAAVNLFTGLFYPFVIAPRRAGHPARVRRVLARHGRRRDVRLLRAAGGAGRCWRSSCPTASSCAFPVGCNWPPSSSSWGSTFSSPRYHRRSWPVHPLPSVWFFGLYQKLNGSADPAFAPLAARALSSLLIAFTLAVATFALAYRRNIRRIIEQPDIAPAGRRRPATRVGSPSSPRACSRSPSNAPSFSSPPAPSRAAASIACCWPPTPASDSPSRWPTAAISSTAPPPSTACITACDGTRSMARSWSAAW